MTVAMTVLIPSNLRLKVSTGNGALNVDGAGSDVQASSGNGRVHIGETQGTVQVSTGNGEVDVRNARGRVRVSTGKGNVEVVTGQFYVGGDLGITLDLELWYRRALSKGIRMTANHFLASIGPGSATIINNYTGQARQLEPIALAVMAIQQAANDTLYFQLQGKVKELYRIGDCVAPRRVEHAILDGECVARGLSTGR